MTRAQRYDAEPWVPMVLRELAVHKHILEIGCGQGIDAIEVCSNKPKKGTYKAIDYSPASIERANEFSALMADYLSIAPEFFVGNAEELAFEDATFDAVYSMGVIHHTARPQKAIDEIFRVLKPGGTAFIALYKISSPKLIVAKILRAVQKALDALMGMDRSVYKFISSRGTSLNIFGTMFHECFGVPYMGCYTKREIYSLFRMFHITRVAAYGANFGKFSRSPEKPRMTGYFWLIVAKKIAPR